jgi:hypothetical protein
MVQHEIFGRGWCFNRFVTKIRLFEAHYMKIIAISQLFSAIFIKNLKITLSIKSIPRILLFYHRISKKADVRLEWSPISARGGDWRMRGGY